MRGNFLLLGALTAFSVTAFSAENITSLANTDAGQPAGAEIYKLGLNAPLIDDHSFPVPVLYFDDLLKPGTKLKATLNVPLRLNIENSRKRRLLTVFSLPGDATVPYGADLKTVNQIKLSSYRDMNSNTKVLTDFVGPNKKIFRAINDNQQHTIDFTLRINHTHFYDGFVKVAISASNGVEVSEICEVTASECVQSVTFRLVPRKIAYSLKTDGLTYLTESIPTQTLSILETNVDLDVNVHNKPFAQVDRKQLPYQTDITFQQGMFAPHLTFDEKRKTQIGHFDIYPVIHYMSNTNYRALDTLVITTATRTPDLEASNKQRAEVVIPEIEALKTISPFNGQGINNTSLPVEASAPKEAK